MALPLEDREAAELAVWEALAEVRDPEIPPLSITDLGIVGRVAMTEDELQIDLLPTFAGCPALDVIRADVEQAVTPLASRRDVRVRFVYTPPWTSDRITPDGREALRRYGLTPPGSMSGGSVVVPLAALRRPPPPATCPFCGSEETTLESDFGPTLCRSIHFCRACRNPFEAFKPKLLP